MCNVCSISPWERLYQIDSALGTYRLHYWPVKNQIDSALGTYSLHYWPVKNQINSALGTYRLHYWPVKNQIKYQTNNLKKNAGDVQKIIFPIRKF